MSVAVRILAAAIVMLFPSDAFSQARVEKNVIYGMYSGAALLMDVHYPAEANGLGIVFVAGSGWATDAEYGAVGLKDGEQPVLWVPPLTRAGYTVFVANHRAVPGFLYPAAVDDVQRAVRFVRHNASRFRVDPDRLGGMGGSSGGHLIALVGTTNGSGLVGDSDPVNVESARLQTVVLRAAGTNLLLQDRPALGAFMGMAPPGPNAPKTSTQWRRYSEGSPITHITSDDPPTLQLHGDADRVVSFQQAVAFDAALKKVGVPSRLVAVPRGGHGPTFGLAAGTATPQDWPDYLSEMVRWFDQHLRAGKPANCTRLFDDN
jgi:acetyl esterase/lipase